MPVTIRRVRTGEDDKLRAIRLRAIADTPTAFATTLEEATARPIEYWRGRVMDAAAGEESVLFVAEHGEDWVGLAGGHVYEEGNAATPYLISMWVDPAFRGRGIGRDLVAKVAQWTRGRSHDHLYLEVESSNRAAISLYTRCGFRPTGQARSHPTYPDLQEVMMVLDLADRSADDGTR